MKLIIVLFSIVIVGLFSEPLFSKDQWVSQIPNGQKFSCSNCHISSEGGGSRNVFGKDVENSLSANKVRWDKIFNLDSDGDGFTNGEELQDTDGQWAIQQANPGNSTLVTKPWDPTSKPTVSSVEDDVVSKNSNVYPIPSLGIVNLNYYLSNNLESNSRLELFNSNGNLLFSKDEETQLGENNISVDLNNQFLNSGVYYLVLRNKYFNIRKRIVFSK